MSLTVICAVFLFFVDDLRVDLLCPDTLHRKLLATAVEPGTSKGEASDVCCRKNIEKTRPVPIKNM